MRLAKLGFEFGKVTVKTLLGSNNFVLVISARLYLLTDTKKLCKSFPHETK